MTLMNSIFGMFNHLIYEYVIFYTNQASITNKCQKWIKKGQKIRKKLTLYAKIRYYTLIMTLMNAIFVIFTNIIYEYYDILYELDLT